MNTKLKLAMAASAIALLAGCEANGGFPDGTGGPGPGGGDFDPQPGETFGPAGPLPNPLVDYSGLECKTYASGQATANVSGNLCTLSQVLDVVTGVLTGTQSCYVADEQLAADGKPDTFALMEATAALLDPAVLVGTTALSSDVSITVSNIGTKPVGSAAAFEVELPGGVANIGILDTLEVSTLLDGVATGESYDAGDVLGLTLLGTPITSAEGRFVFGFFAENPFNELKIRISSSVLSADVPDLLTLGLGDSGLFVYDACTQVGPAAE